MSLLIFRFCTATILTSTLFTMVGVKRLPPSASFSPVTSTNVGTSPQNFLTFSFKTYDRLV